MPYRMSGEEGAQAAEVRRFISRLEELLSLPIRSWDERLTSVQADRALREGSFTRKKRAKRVDSVASCLILQSYLDCLRAS